MENDCVPWDNFKAELRLCVLKNDFFDKVKDIEAKFPFFASRAGMEGANRKLEELQRYATDKFKDIKEEIIYSELLNINGIIWRIKVYPKGNGVAKD